MRFGNLILLLKLVDNMCPSRWLVGMNGLLKEIAKDLVKVDPTNKLPISPGPQVAVKTSISFGSIFYY